MTHMIAAEIALTYTEGFQSPHVIAMIETMVEAYKDLQCDLTSSDGRVEPDAQAEYCLIEGVLDDLRRIMSRLLTP